MADFYNAADVYAYLAALDVPKWKTPDAIKRAYAHTQDVKKAYAKQADSLLKAYAKQTPLQNAKSYRNLVAHYNSEYQKNALLAAKQAQALSANVDGLKNSYADAAGQGVYNAYMAQRGAAAPALMAAAAKAHAEDKAAQAAAVSAMQQQQGALGAATRALFDAQLNAAVKQSHTQSTGIQSKQNALAKVFAKQLAYEKALAKKK
ncbi:MAG: hypothetical protein IKE65_03350 [Clostridia bacterium]|nr:hypothetical protein [Clostridia bacterium]